MRSACRTVAVAAALAGATTRLGADDRPTLSVAVFTATRTSLSSAQAVELADDLAARLEETGRFRVMPREWLPADEAFRRTTRLDVLSRAAIDAGVSYLVVPSITGPLTGLKVSRRRPHPLAGIGRAVAGLAGRTGAAPGCGPMQPDDGEVAVEVRIIDAATGEVVTTSVLRARIGLTVSGGLPPRCGLGGGPVGMAAALVRPDRFEALRRANAEFARSFTVPTSGSGVTRTQEIRP